MESLDFFDELIRRREVWYTATRENKFDFDILLSGLYHDPSHFIYEILQNAEDASATSIKFSLFSDRLEIIHNGTAFSLDDIEAITGIGNTTKSDDLTAIGNFGVGFKSIFAITQSPSIHSGPFHFEIKNFVVPSILEGLSNLAETKFVFPFNHKERSNEELFDLISTKLQNLEDQTLLFLSNIEEIKWQTPNSSGHYLKEVTDVDCDLLAKKIEVIAQSNESESFQGFLVFNRPFDIDQKALSVEIAYQLSTDNSDTKQRIIPVEDSRLIVYFPTEKTTFLKFLIHGPYKTTPNRENIPLEDKQNQQITDEIANLVADSLLQIRNLGFLDVGFLQILPVDPEYSTSFHPIYSSIFEAVKTRLLGDEKLLPTDTGKYTSASNALLARVKDLTDLFTRSDIEILFNKSHWMDTGITIDRAPVLRKYILNHLDVDEIRLEDFASVFTTDFFDTKSDEWMSRFYSRLNDTPALWREGHWQSEGILRQKPIIRLQDGTHICPYDEDSRVQAYLPTDNDSLFPVVKNILLKNPAAKEFLVALGLTQPDIFAEIREFIIPKYKVDQPNVEETDYFLHIKKLIQAFSTGRESKQNQLITDLESINILKSTNTTTGITRFTPSKKTYKFHDYLKEYFLGLDDIWFIAMKPENPNDMENMEDLLNWLEVLDAPRRIQISDTLSDENKESLRNSNCTASYPEEDYQLDGLENFFNYPVTLERSLILWNVLKMHIEQLGIDDARIFFQGTYSWFYYTRYSSHFPAKFLKTLQTKAWLYDRSGVIRRPGEINLSQVDGQYNVEFSNIDTLKEMLAFKSDLIDQLPEEQREKLLLIEGISLEALRELISKIKLPMDEEIDDLVSDHEEIPAEPDEDEEKTPSSNRIEDSRSTTQSSAGLSEKRESKRLISYVYPIDSGDEGTEKPKQRSRRDEIGKLGVELVIRFEKSQGRDPTDMETLQIHHPGFDVKSVDMENHKDVRYIEVKSTIGNWDSQNPARMTKTEFEFAVEYGEKFWLYVVEHVESENFVIYGIKNPAKQAEYFLFDHGWQLVANFVEKFKSNKNIALSHFLIIPQI